MPKNSRAAARLRTIPELSKHDLELVQDAHEQGIKPAQLERQLGIKRKSICKYVGCGNRVFWLCVFTFFFSRPAHHRCRLYESISKSEPLVKKWGRPTLFCDEHVEQIVAKVRDEAQKGTAMTKAEIKEEIHNKIIKINVEEKEKNDLLVFDDPSDRWFRRFVKQNDLKPVVATAHTDSRLSNLNEIENAVSQAASAALFRDVVPELFFNGDGCTAVTGSQFSTKPLVYAPNTTIKEMQQRGRAVSTSKQEANPYRSIPVFTITSASGDRDFSALQIQDARFNELVQVPINEKLLISFMPPNHVLSEGDYMRQLLLDHIIPALLSKRERVMREMNAVKQEASPSSSAFDPRFRIILTLDGDQPQVAAALSDAFVARCAELGVEIIKWAAACSLTQQPNDAGLMHRKFHRHHSPEQHGKRGRPSSRMKEFLDGGRFASIVSCLGRTLGSETIRKFLTHIEFILDDSFGVSSVQDAWRICGLYPEDRAVILNGYAQWGSVSNGDAHKIFECVLHFLCRSSHCACLNFRFSVP